jgi:hypothetical protein
LEGKISVIGEVPVSATVPPGARGAEVIVAAAGEEVRAAARLAPAAVLLLVDASPDQVGGALDATLWGSHRVVGVSRDDAERTARAVAVGELITLRAVLRGGERQVTLGRAGVTALD